MASKKILLVEDDEYIRAALSELFRCEGYNVVLAENGQMGLEVLAAEMPDLVFLDLMMPVLDGYGFLRGKEALPPNLSGIPVVLLTATGEKGAPNFPAREVLTKPVEIDKLLGVAARYLA
jgi:two-component system, chemotaxis family, chemotaxis protein CheY